jgi:tRNA (mo5U34)-methyltransferase
VNPAIERRLLKSGQRPHQDGHSIASEIQRLAPWFHNFELADGIWTNNDGASPGPDYPAKRWHLIEPLLADLVQNKTCLDVGCSSGFFSLKLKELGASDVLGVDLGEQLIALEQARYAARVLHLDVRFEQVSVYELARLNQQFDIVLFMGVLYHLRHPLLALETLRKVCRGVLIVQSITTSHNTTSAKDQPIPENTRLWSDEQTHPAYPALRFVEHALDNDTSSWFVPNAAGVLAMLRSSGFTIDRTLFADDHDIVVRCR